MLSRSSLVSSFRLRFSSCSKKNLRFGVSQLRPYRQHPSYTTLLQRPSLLRGYQIQFVSKPVRSLATMTSPAALDRDILPDNVKPVNYDISIFDLELGGGFSYQASVAIQLKVAKSSKEITLNSHKLKIHSAELSVESTKTTQSLKATDISYDAPRQRATLTFPDDLPVSENANLIIKFQGTMNNDMAGFYRSYV
jgi:hypothetical protein